MKEQNKNKKETSLTTPTKAMVSIYSFLAIILVIIPEWIAEFALSIENKSHYNGLPNTNEIWELNPELKISRMRMKELRKLAFDLNLKDYARENRKGLSKKLLKELRKRQIS